MSYPNHDSPGHDKDHHRVRRAFRLTVTASLALLPALFVRSKRALAVAAGVASMALPVAACGGGGPGGPAAASVSDTLAHILAYSQCMQSHGDPSFPDPVKNSFGGYGFMQNPQHMSGPAFSTAQKACKKLEPDLNLTGAEKHTAINQLLKLAICMRAHGIRNLPDPNTAAGGVGIVIPNGADPHSPQWQSAQRVCQHYVPPPKPVSGG